MASSAAAWARRSWSSRNSLSTACGAGCSALREAAAVRQLSQRRGRGARRDRPAQSDVRFEPGRQGVGGGRGLVTVPCLGDKGLASATGGAIVVRQQLLQDGRVSARTQGGEGEQDCDRGQRRGLLLDATKRARVQEGDRRRNHRGGHVRCLSRRSTRRPSRPDGFLGASTSLPFGTS